METSNDIMKKIGEKRVREHYKQLYLNMKGYCVCLAIAVIILLGITLSAIHGVNTMEQRLNEKQVITIMPSGERIANYNEIISAIPVVKRDNKGVAIK